MKIKVPCTNDMEVKFIDLDCCDAILLNKSLLTIYGYAYRGDDVTEIHLCTVKHLGIADKVLERLVNAWRSGKNGVLHLDEYIKELNNAKDIEEDSSDNIISIYDIRERLRKKAELLEYMLATEDDFSGGKTVVKISESTKAVNDFDKRYVMYSIDALGGVTDDIEAFHFDSYMSAVEFAFSCGYKLSTTKSKIFTNFVFDAVVSWLGLRDVNSKPYNIAKVVTAVCTDAVTQSAESNDFTCVCDNVENAVLLWHFPDNKGVGQIISKLVDDNGRRVIISDFDLTDIDKCSDDSEMFLGEPKVDIKRAIGVSFALSLVERIDNFDEFGIAEYGEE